MCMQSVIPGGVTLPSLTLVSFLLNGHPLITVYPIVDHLLEYETALPFLNLLHMGMWVAALLFLRGVKYCLVQAYHFELAP